METAKADKKLAVVALTGDFMYKDAVHVHWKERSKMKNGDIVRVTAIKDDDTQTSNLFAMRGRSDQDKGKIGVDFLGCAHLNIQVGQSYNFAFRRTTFWEKITWARESSDPGARIAMMIAYWSALIGLLGFGLGVIGVIPVLKDFKEWLSERPLLRIDSADQTKAPNKNENDKERDKAPN